MPARSRRLLLRSCLRVLAAAALAAAPALPLRAQAPIDFELRDLQGNPVRLSDHLGQDVVLVDFWATWCVPCVKELTHFQRFHEKYADRGLLILAITVDGPQSVPLVKPFLDRYKYTFPVLFDTQSKVIALYNPRVVMPYTVLIGRDGKIARVHQGYSLGDETALESEIVELLAPPASAAPAGAAVNATESFLFRNFTDEDYTAGTRGGRTSQVINQFEVSVAKGRFLAGARWDENWDFAPWFDRFRRSDRWARASEGAFLPGGLADYRSIVLRKSFVEASAGGFTLRAGDFYQTVGRGLAFSLLKTFEKEGLEHVIDTTVDGGKLSWSGGRFEADAFGGWVSRPEDEVADGRTIHDGVYGGGLGYRLGGAGQVRASVFGADVRPGTLLGDKSVLMESIALDLPNLDKRFRLYGEALLLRKTKHYVDGALSGHGLYLEGSASLGRWTLLLQAKDYRHLDFEYNRPPLLETEQLPIVANQFVDSAEDITGVSGRVDYAVPGTPLVAFGTVTLQEDRSHGPRRGIGHLFGGLERKFRESGWWTVLAGYRRESSSSLVFWDTAGGTWHAQGNVSYPLGGRLSLEGDLEAKRFDGDLRFGGNLFRYSEVRSYVSLHSSPRWVFTFLYDYTEDPKILTFNPKRNWLGGQVEWRFSQANAIRVFYGANKGGVKCAGGICRFFPPFEGLRVDCFVRF